MSFLTELRLGEFDPHDMGWVVIGCKAVPTGAEPYHVMMDLGQGSARGWRIGDHKGILITKIFQHPQSRELFIFLLAGEGVFDILEEAWPEVEALARAERCSRIGCFTKKGLEKVLSERLHFKPEQTYCVKEV